MSTTTRGAFELSAKQNRIVVNCGLPATSRGGWRQVARATAAHSTVTFNDTSSARFVESGAVRRVMFGAPMLGGPREIKIARDEQADGMVLRPAVKYQKVAQLSGVPRDNH